MDPIKRRCKFCFKYGLDQHRDGHLMDNESMPIPGDPSGLATDGICLRAYPAVEKDMEESLKRIKTQKQAEIEAMWEDGRALEIRPTKEK
jgi:hypothetical protein